MRLRLATALILGLVLPGCESPAPGAAAAGATLDLPGVPNWRRWSERVAQGAQPQGDAGFATLRAQGIVTVLSVDGALPDVQAAARHGLTYVHVPIGYDGLSPEEQAAIVKTVQDSPGPVFVHCHHGRHRGPAAAAIARVAAGGVSTADAEAGLRESGCSPTYTGLFRDVLAFRAPDAAALARVGPLPSAVRPAGVREAMVHVSERFDLLQASGAAAWTLLPQFPDVTPAHEASMLGEGLRELARLPDAAAKGAPFLDLARLAERQAAALEDALRAGDAQRADAAWVTLKHSCSDCHARWRD